MESVWMCYAWDSVLSLVQWQCHQSLCQVLYDHQPGAKIPIPPCPEDTHPLQIFEETHVDRNLYWWVVFVLWLKAHPNAWRWYRIIQKAHPDTVPTIPTLWDECQKIWPLERMCPNHGWIVPRSSSPGEFRRCATACQSPSSPFEQSPTGLGKGFGLYLA